MRPVKLLINFLDTAGREKKTVLEYINPEVDDVKLANFVTSLNNLTTNTVRETFKVVNWFLSSATQDYQPTAADYDYIFNNDQFTFTGFTQSDVDDIFNDDNFNFNGFTQSDVDFVFS